MNYLLDTNICIYFLKGQFDLPKKFENAGLENLFISEITIAELLFGAEKSKYPKKNKTVITELLSKLNHVPIYGALEVYAKEKARLSREGKIIDDFDLLIGATAVAHEMTLITNNEKHFQRLGSLKIANWTM